MSDGGGVQDQAYKKVLCTQVPQVLDNLFFPTRKAAQNSFANTVPF
jgi:hypothetical protein